MNDRLSDVSIHFKPEPILRSDRWPPGTVQRCTPSTSNSRLHVGRNAKSEGTEKHWMRRPKRNGLIGGSPPMRRNEHFEHLHEDVRPILGGGLLTQWCTHVTRCSRLAGAPCTRNTCLHVSHGLCDLAWVSGCQIFGRATEIRSRNVSCTRPDRAAVDSRGVHHRHTAVASSVAMWGGHMRKASVLEGWMQPLQGF